MRLILDNILHVFILAMMGGFLILCASAAVGGFDVWTKRYARTMRGKRVTQNRTK